MNDLFWSNYASIGDRGVCDQIFTVLLNVVVKEVPTLRTIIFFSCFLLIFE